MLAGAAVLIAVIAAGAAVGLANPGRIVDRLGNDAAPAYAAPIAPPATATVTERTLTAQTAVAATLGYAGDYHVVNQAHGIVTALPSPGQIVTQGQPLYAVDGAPVVLLNGATPAYRTIAQGMAGPDVAELNADLVALGDATRAQLDPAADRFSAATTTALKRLQATLGVDQTGTLALGQAVFLPGSARVTTITATLGAPAQPGATVLVATSTTREVAIALDINLQGKVAVGDAVTITLPDQTTTPGVVSMVGTVATVPASTSSGSNGGPGYTSAPTIAVDVTPTDPAVTGNLDQAPVKVAIITASVQHALVVPVTALLAPTSGGYAVEVVDAGGVHHLVTVTLGLFDDAAGLVQVAGSGVHAGQQVVVPAA